MEGRADYIRAKVGDELCRIDYDPENRLMFYQQQRRFARMRLELIDTWVRQDAEAADKQQPALIEFPGAASILMRPPGWDIVYS